MALCHEQKLSGSVFVLCPSSAVEEVVGEVYHSYFVAQVGSLEIRLIGLAHPVLLCQYPTDVAPGAIVVAAGGGIVAAQRQYVVLVVAVGAVGPVAASVEHIYGRHALPLFFGHRSEPFGHQPLRLLVAVVGCCLEVAVAEMEQRGIGLRLGVLLDGEGVAGRDVALVGSLLQPVAGILRVGFTSEARAVERSQVVHGLRIVHPRGVERQVVTPHSVLRRAPTVVVAECKIVESAHIGVFLPRLLIEPYGLGIVLEVVLLGSTGVESLGGVGIGLVVGVGKVGSAHIYNKVGNSYFDKDRYKFPTRGDDVC